MKQILLTTVIGIAGLSLTSAYSKEFHGSIHVFAGTGEKGYDGDGSAAIDARLDNPFGIVRGPDGALYVCDTGNHVIRRIDKEGQISTVAGNGTAGYSGDGGDATKAQLFEPYEVRFDNTGDMFFVEMKNHLVRRVNMKTGTISTIAGTGKQGFGGDEGPATEATFNRPHSIQFAPNGDLYVCDIGNHRLRTVDVKSGLVRTVAGTGERRTGEDGSPFATAPLNGPRAIDFDANGDIWLALREGNAVYRLDMKKRTMHHIAGTGKKGFTGNGGPARRATLSGPKGVSIGPHGNVFLADTESHSVRMIDRSTNPPTLTLLAGTGKRGPGAAGDPLRCTMARLHGIFVDRDGSIFIGDSENHRIWKIEPH